MSGAMLRTCKACGAQNRISAKHIAATGRCGSCKAALPPPPEPLEVGEGDFDAIVQGARVPILVDFWASWCGPCRAAAPEVHALAEEMVGKALVLKVNTEQNEALARRYRVESIPNFVVLSRGQVVFQQAGMIRRDQMRKLLEMAGEAGKNIVG